MLFQFLSDWKLDRQPNNKPRSCQSSPPRSPSVTSMASFPLDNIDWHDGKQTWSFQKDYVSFPSLEQVDSQEEDSQPQQML